MSKSSKIALGTRQQSTAAYAVACALAMSGNTFRLSICPLLVLLSLLALAPLTAQQAPVDARVLLQAARVKQYEEGQLKPAIEIYQRIFADASVPRDVRAQALLGLAECADKQGRPARLIYEQVVRDFGDQAAALQARKWLANQAQSESSTPEAPQIDQRIEWSQLGSVGPADTDGKRAFFSSGDNLYLGDLAGHSKHLILNTKHYGWVPCRDFSLVALDLLTTPIRQHTFALIKADGTGYRTLIRDDAKNSIFQQNQPFDMSCSWDDRNFLLSDFSLKSSIAGQLWLVSAADGERRVLADMKGWRIRKAVFSPDGRFAAYEVWPTEASSPHTSRVFVVPVDGGDPRLVYESAPWHAGNELLTLMDWTADGRFLILHDVRQGRSALYLLPMSGGAAVGGTSFVRFGNFDDGYTTPSGALVYEDKSASPSNVDVSLASISPDDLLVDWHPVDLNANGASNPRPSFSPDGSLFAYVARDADPVRRDVIVRDLATGQEREVYRSIYASTVCEFSSRDPKLFCTVENEHGETDLISIAIDSGAVEKIATFSGSRYLLAVARDDSAFYFSGNAWLLGVYEPPVFRWDRSTQKETIVEPPSEDSRLLSVSSDGDFIARLLDGVVSIRPVNGGNWQALATGVTSKTPPSMMPDGKWVLYQSVDSTGRPGLFRVPVTGGSSERVDDLPNNNSADSFFFSPDGKRALVLAEKEADYGLSALKNFVPPVKKEHEQ